MDISRQPLIQSIRLVGSGSFLGHTPAARLLPALYKKIAQHRAHRGKRIPRVRFLTWPHSNSQNAASTVQKTQYNIKHTGMKTYEDSRMQNEKRRTQNTTQGKSLASLSIQRGAGGFPCTIEKGQCEITVKSLRHLGGVDSV